MTKTQISVMHYELKNGKSVLIRRPYIEDAEQIINLLKTADGETRFLARNPGEFKAIAMYRGFGFEIVGIIPNANMPMVHTVMNT